MGVAKDLDFDMAGPLDGLFENKFAGAEGVQRFRSRRRKRRRQPFRRSDQPHAAPAAADRRLHHDGKADPRGLRDQDVVGLVLVLIAGHARHAGGDHPPLRRGLVAH